MNPGDGGCGRSAAAADSPQRSDQPHVSDCVSQLGPPPGLKVRQQVKLAGVICAMTRAAAERHDTERVAAPAERPRNQMKSVRASGPSATEEKRGTSGLGLGCGRVIREDSATVESRMPPVG